jgi:hypothetical protein
MSLFSRIPVFPEFRQLSISDGPLFHKLFQEYPPIISEYTFTNIFAWIPQYDFKISRKDEMVVVLTKFCGHGGLYPPIGPRRGEGIFLLLKESARLGIADHFHCADETIVASLEGFKSELLITEDRDQFDYIYLREDLVNLSGNRFHDKKNLLRQFERKYDATFEPLTVATIEEALKFEHSWCTTRECEKDPRLSKEMCAIYRMLSHFEVLRLAGAAVRFGEKIIGITMGEPLNEDTYVVHVEKADDKYRGIYQFINQRFAASIDSKYMWINREQDLGIPGLRRAKQSYNPARIGKKYIVKLVH